MLHGKHHFNIPGIRSLSYMSDGEQRIAGFRLKEQIDMQEYNGSGSWWVHETTGCEVFHLHCDDPENLFAFGFPTVPADSSGVAHILEHTVLCGSRNYPLKDPFLRMLQSSVYTFLNAFTFPDKTVYPAASTVEKDLFNLMKVYGDAVFFPCWIRQCSGRKGIVLYIMMKAGLESLELSITKCLALFPVRTQWRCAAA